MAVQTGGASSALGRERTVLLDRLLDHLVWLILLIILVIFSLTIENFFQVGIFLNILQHATFVGLIAIGLVIPTDVKLLAGIYAFGATLAITIAHLSIIRLRVRDPDRPRPFRIPLGIPWRGAELPLPAIVAATRRSSSNAGTTTATRLPASISSARRRAGGARRTARPRAPRPRRAAGP